MQFGAVILPVAAATIVNTALAWFAWKGTLAERRNGRLPWQTEVGLVAYLAAMSATVYLLKDASISTPLALFGAVFASEALGLLITHMLGQAFVAMRGESWRKRAFPMAAAVFLTVAMFAGVFTS